MTDRELLEAAARAAGYDMVAVLPGYPIRIRGQGLWDPLTDDGDALRLAVKLRIDLIHNDPRDNDSWVMAGHLDFVEDVDGEANRGAATRRAIVRAAAAQIGEGMV